LTTPKLLLPELIVGQAGKELTHNQALAVLDQIAQANVVSRALATPPVSPANGAMYIVAAASTGAWTGKTNQLAYWLTTVAAWSFAVPAAGWQAWVTDEARRYEFAGSLWSLWSSGADIENKLINGSFQINQRAVSGTVVLAAGIYGHDRWKAGASGATYTFSKTANITTITISAGSLQQVIEGLNLQSGTHTLSWSGTAQGKINAGSYSATGVTGASVGGTNLTVEFNTGTISSAAFQAGVFAAQSEPRFFGQELALCQRYYEILEARTGGYHIGGNSLRTSAYYKVSKRATPTLTVVVTENSNAGTPIVDSTLSSLRYLHSVTVTGDSVTQSTITASAEL
jgi:hypothetical protein